MNMPNYQELITSKYILILDFYDRPLTFVAKIESRNELYLFKYISEKQYFISPITAKTATKLNEWKNLTKLYKYLKQQQQIQIVSFDFDHKQANYVPFADFKNAEKYLPKSGVDLTYDYQNGIEIKPKTDLGKYLDLPEK